MQQFSQNGYTDQEVIDELTFQTGSREVTFRYDLLDSTNTFKASLTNVIACTVANDYLSAIKRTAKFTLLDDGSVNYLSDRIKPWVRIKLPGDTRKYSAISNNNFGHLTLPWSANYSPTGGIMDNYYGALTAYFPFNEVSGGFLAQDQSGPFAHYFEPFQSQVNAFFDTFAGGASYNNNEGDIPSTGTPAGGAQASMSRTTPIDLSATDSPNHGALLAWKAVSVPASGSPSPQLEVLIDSAINGDYINFNINNGTFYGTVSVSSVVSNITMRSYNSSTDVYWRIHVMPNTVYYDVSADALTWTNLGSQTITDSSFASCTITFQTLQAGGTSYSGSEADFLIDDLEYQKGDTNTGLISAGVSPGAVGIADGSCFQFSGGSGAANSVVLPNGHAYFYQSPAASGFKQIDDTFSHVVWIRPNSVVNHGIWQTSDNSASLKFDASGNVVFSAKTAASTIAAYCSNPFGGSLQMIGVTWRIGENPKIYLNGLPQTVTMTGTDITNTMSGVSGDLWVGDGFDGAIDAVSFLNTTIVEPEMFVLYRAGSRTGPFGTQNYAEWPQGVFLLSSPARQTDGNGVITRAVDAYDQLQVLTDDLVSDRYAVTAGTNYITAVEALLPAGDVNITPCSSTLPNTKEYAPGTSKLAIINDLLSAINYESLSYDETGRAVVKPYVPPSVRNPTYTYADDQHGVMLPTMTQTLDLFSVPNKWVAVVSEGDRPPLTSTYTNSNPSSVTSTISRGRTIVHYESGVQCPDQASLDTYVQNLAIQASQIYETTQFQTAIMPVHQTNEVLTLDYTDLGMADKYAEMSWTFDLKDGASMTHNVRRTVSI